MTRSAAAALVFLLQTTLASSALAQLEPVAPQLQVNTYTTGSQLLPAVAVGDDGRALVAWSSAPWSAGEGAAAIVGRRYEADGGALGGEFQIDTGPGYLYGPPELERFGDGFLMAWTHSASPGDGLSAPVVRPLDADGNAVGAVATLRDVPLPSLRLRTVTRGADGRFLVTWEHRADALDQVDIEARLLDAAGAPTGAVFQVNDPSPYRQQYPAVAALGSAGYLVVWHSRLDGEVFGAHGVSARGVDPDGALLGAEFLVRSTPEPVEEPDVAARPDGSFVVAWAEVDSYTPTFQDILVQRFASTGAPLGSVFQANVYTTGGQNHPAVAVDAAGDFHVVWDSASGYPPIDEGVLGRSFDSSGAALGSEYRVGDGLQAGGARPELLVDPSGRAWTVWTDGASPDGFEELDGDAQGAFARPMWVAGQCRDLDGDGYGAPGAADCAVGPATDCDDGDAAVNPGAVEIPANGIDDDCDPSTPSGCNAEELGHE